MGIAVDPVNRALPEYRRADVRAQGAVLPFLRHLSGGDFEHSPTVPIAGRNEDAIADDKRRRAVDVVTGLPSLPPQLLARLRIEAHEARCLEHHDRALAGDVRGDRRRVSRVVLAALPGDF